jgi:hypothetical protein
LGSRKAAADLSAMRAEFARMMENKLAWERIADSQKPGPLKALAKLEKDQLEARMVALAKKIQDLRDRFCK